MQAIKNATTPATTSVLEAVRIADELMEAMRFPTIPKEYHGYLDYKDQARVRAGVLSEAWVRVMERELPQNICDAGDAPRGYIEQEKLDGPVDIAWRQIRLEIVKTIEGMPLDQAHAFKQRVLGWVSSEIREAAESIVN